MTRWITPALPLYGNGHALAARESGAAGLIYHAGETALHAREHFAGLNTPVVGSLSSAVRKVLAGSHPAAEWGT